MMAVCTPRLRRCRLGTSTLRLILGWAARFRTKIAKNGIRSVIGWGLPPWREPSSFFLLGFAGSQTTRDSTSLGWCRINHGPCLAHRGLGQFLQGAFVIGSKGVAAVGVTVMAVMAVMGLAGCSSATAGGAGMPSHTDTVQTPPETSIPPVITVPVTPEPEAPDPIRSVVRNAHPGFDTRRYPGDAALRAWSLHSPYEWVGYYLVAPCQTGTTWVGKRNVIREIGFGTAVVFIGEQDWAGPPSDSGAAAKSGGTQCTVANLTAAKGSIDAVRADSTAAAEGFPNGTIVYLDIEYVLTLSSRYSTYIRSWTHDMLASGRYVPGVYVHERNAEGVRAIIASEFAAAGRTSAPPFWVAARPAGSGTPANTFDLAVARPATSGFPFATVWQGVFNINETWGGATILIDVNLAATRDPSSVGQ